MTFEEMEAGLRQRLEALRRRLEPSSSTSCASQTSTDADRIGESWGHSEPRTFRELLIDLEEDKEARAVVFGLLAEMERQWP